MRLRSNFIPHDDILFTLNNVEGGISLLATISGIVWAANSLWRELDGC